MRYEEELLRLHNHICPRQVLGYRMGELAGDLLSLPLPQRGKRLLVFVETDGCFADGITVATGCSLGHRTLRLVDLGKVAATFVDTRAEPERAVRIHPHPEARSRAAATYATANAAANATTHAGEPPAGPRSRWHMQLAAYQVMPADELFVVEDVQLTISTRALLSRPGVRVTCAACGEEVLNEREVVVDGRVLCQRCAGEDSYYRS